MTYSFHLRQPSLVLFGPNARKELPELISRDDRIAVVCGSNTLINNGVVSDLTESIKGDTTLLHLESHEPTVQSINTLTEHLRTGAFTKVIGIGGGSTLDSVKASAALVNQPEGSEVLNFLEGIGSGLPLDQPGIPTILMPTTAGTGAEATQNAVVFSSQHQVKKSLRSFMLLPEAVVIDPTLHVSCSFNTTTHSGLDAITQCFESYISCRATEYTKRLSLHGFKLGVENILQAANHPKDLSARTAMAHCAFNSGVALANSGLGVAHGIAAALGSAAAISHGESCAFLLPFAAKLNESYCTSDYAKLSKAIGLHAPGELPNYLATLCRSLKVRSTLESLQIPQDLVAPIVERSYGNSMHGNPFLPEPERLVDALIGYYVGS